MIACMTLSIAQADGRMWATTPRPVGRAETGYIKPLKATIIGRNVVNIPAVLPLARATTGAITSPVAVSPMKTKIDEIKASGILAITGHWWATASIAVNATIPTGMPKTIIAMALPIRAVNIDVREIIVNSAVPFQISELSAPAMPKKTLFQTVPNGAPTLR